MIQSTKEERKKAKDWNADVKIGDAVDYYSYLGAAPQRLLTRSIAKLLGGHTAVVWLEGKSSCVAVDACRKVKKGKT